jgi:hypothetical protein
VGLVACPVLWEPFLNGNVKAGQNIDMEVCPVDGRDDFSGSRCGYASRSVDG